MIENNPENYVVVFEGSKIRRTEHEGRWYFSVIDVVSVLTQSSAPRRYWSDLKSNLKSEGFESYDKIVQLKLPSSDGKSYLTNTTYDEEADAAYIYLTEDAKVASTVEVNQDMVIDLDADQKIIGIELLNAKDKLRLPELKKEAN